MVLGALAASASAGAVWAQDLMGQPTPGAIGMQPGASPLQHHQADFHNFVLMPVITAITPAPSTSAGPRAASQPGAPCRRFSMNP